MKGKLAVFLFALYGAVVAVATHFDGGYYILNMFVEDYVMVPLILHYGNDLGTPILGYDLLGVRVLTSVTFWGGIAIMVYGMWWSLKVLIPIKTEKIN